MLKSRLNPGNAGDGILKTLKPGIMKKQEFFIFWENCYAAKTLRELRTYLKGWNTIVSAFYN